MRLLIGLVLMVLTACQPKSTTEKIDYTVKIDSLKFKYKPYKIINPTNNVDSIKGFIDSLVNTKELSHRGQYNFLFRSYLHDENFIRLMLAEENSIPLLIERIDDTTQTTAFFSKPYRKSPFVLGQICLILVDWKVEGTPFWTIYNKYSELPELNTNISRDYYHLWTEDKKDIPKQLKKIKKLYQLWFKDAAFRQVKPPPQPILFENKGYWPTDVLANGEKVILPYPSFTLFYRVQSKKLPTKESILKWWENN